jgi:hypothetical protein
MEVELSEAKKAAQIRELTRLVISLRDEVNKKHSGFFGKKESEPIPPGTNVIKLFLSVIYKFL